jgi:hypothetical protein
MAIYTFRFIRLYINIFGSTWLDIIYILYIMYVTAQLTSFRNELDCPASVACVPLKSFSVRSFWNAVSKLT